MQLHMDYFVKYLSNFPKYLSMQICFKYTSYILIFHTEQELHFYITHFGVKYFCNVLPFHKTILY